MTEAAPTRPGKPPVAVFLDVENVFHPYGRSLPGLNDDSRQRLVATHPQVTAAAALRLGAAVAADVAGWIDARYERTVSIAVGKRGDAGVGTVRSVLKEEGFVVVEVPRGSNRADYEVIGRMYRRLAESQTEAAYLVGSDDGLVVDAAFLASSHVATARTKDELPPAGFHVLTGALAPRRREWYRSGGRQVLVLQEIPKVLEWARRIRRSDARRAREHRSRVLRSVTTDLSRRTRDEQRQRDFASAIVQVASGESDLEAAPDRQEWLTRVEEAFVRTAAAPELTAGLLAALEEGMPNPGDPTGGVPADPADEILTTGLDMLHRLGLPVTEQHPLHVDAASAPLAVQRAFLRWVDARGPAPAG